MHQEIPTCAYVCCYQDQSAAGSKSLFSNILLHRPNEVIHTNDTSITVSASKFEFVVNSLDFYRKYSFTSLDEEYKFL